MNTKSLLYFVEATKDLNFTQTAKRLKISQQALSQHISKLETQYGVALFVRKPQLALSYAGETLLPHAQQLLHDEQVVKQLVADITDRERGSLRVAVSLPRCTKMLQEVIPQFKARYPQVTLDVTESVLESPFRQVATGDCSIAVGLVPKDIDDLQLIPLADDPWFLLVSNSLLRRHYSAEEIDELLTRQFVTLPMLSRLPLIGDSPLVDPENRSPEQGDESGASVLFTSTRPHDFVDLCTAGVAALVTSRLALNPSQTLLPDHIHVLPLAMSSEQAQITTVCLAYSRQRPVSPCGEYFIDLVCKYFKAYNKSISNPPF